VIVAGVERGWPRPLGLERIEAIMFRTIGDRPSLWESRMPARYSGCRGSWRDCVLLCPFHHQVVIHRWGWTLVVNSDGTTTAWNKDKTKVLHGHGPPARAG
jgi:hypothetical protein